MKVLSLLISVVALSAVAACAQGGSQAAGLHALDGRIPQLSNGASIEEVEDVLGAPRNRVELEEGEISLYYGSTSGLWQLLFSPELISRARYYQTGHWPPGKSVEGLDHDVRKLRLGISFKAVERQLGKPESWQISIPKQREYLWYGPGRWKLVFSHESLVRKVLYRGGSPAH